MRWGDRSAATSGGTVVVGAVVDPGPAGTVVGSLVPGPVTGAAVTGGVVVAVVGDGAAVVVGASPGTCKNRCVV